MGALFGSTPESRHFFRADNPPTGWVSVNGGYACPYLRCPNADCGGQLVWRDADRNANVERLQCASCGTATQPGELVLTRESMRADPMRLLVLAQLVDNTGDLIILDGYCQALTASVRNALLL